jgi:PAS domain S-box-containing protein
MGAGMTRPALSIRTLFSASTMVIAGLLSLLLIVAWRMSVNQQAIVKDYDTRFSLYQAAAEMQQSVDDLARMARLYAATGNRRFRDYHDNILAIRNGEAPRPHDYSSSYWTLVIGDVIQHKQDGTRQSLVNRLHQLGMQQDEFKLLRDALQESDELVAIEREAIAAVEESRPGLDGMPSQRGQVGRARGLGLLSDERYFKARARVMAQLDQFRITVSQRTTEDVAVLAAQQVRWISLALMLLGLTLLVVILKHLYVARSIIRPIHALQQHAAAIALGDYSARNEVKAGNELSELGAALNMSTKAIESDLVYRAETRKILELSEARFRTLVTATSQIVWWTNAEGQVSGDMPSWRSYTGQTLDEIQGAGWAGAVHPDDVDRTLEVWNQAVAARSLYEVEYRIRRHDGIYRQFMVRGVSIADKDGRVSEWIGACTDIDDQKRNQAELIQSQRFLQSTLDSLTAHIAILDEQGRIIGTNEGWKRFAADNSIILQRADVGLNYLEICDAATGDDARDASQVAQGIREVIAGQRDFFSYEYPCHSPEAQRWFVVRVTRFSGQGVSPVVVAHENITERKLAELRMRQFNAELEASVSARTLELESAVKDLEGFSYSVSHDLRAPLRAIDNFSGILLEDYADKLDAEGKRLFKVVRDNTAKMGQLINDILEFSRAGRGELHITEMDIGALAKEVFEGLDGSAGDKIPKFEVAELPKAYCDPTAIKQVLVNLLSNAIKFSRTQDTPKITMTGKTTDSECIYSVSDNGVGFDMKYSHKLFGVFQRLHAVTEFEGTGIGLAIVRRIIEKHGGRVWAESEPGTRTVFHFSLPVKGTQTDKESHHD